MKSKLQTEDESTSRGVSPVIGVILMVAITVILAAVIAAFVLDLGQGQSSSVNAAVSIDKQSDGNVTISLTDKGNAEEVIIRTSDGNPAQTNTSSPADAILTTTGQSVNLDNSESYSVVAKSGEDETQIGSYSP
ncbi:type IV pilin N-terminal domain-containing protein [Natronosalvus amylolyticus]|uniref:type IV pilin N-terminal domain-containing protein n=1 Tax=Natronosalvus amylolyticus TaxID=2961994 RepID=UPI0020C9B035|nr:type IV pilin N-terminal domain-containing protein [Natronosalvus amylolyticus]